MSICLITGISGFMGSHLAEFLSAQGWGVLGVVREDTGHIAHGQNGVAFFRCDILNRAQIESVVREARPEVIFHLAAQSLPSRSWQGPEATFRVNVLGTLNLLDAVRSAGLGPVLVVAGSSAEYDAGQPEEMPIAEDTPLRPASPYGVSKAAASLLALLYSRAFGMKVVLARPFFVIGPRKVGDVCSDFARGIVAVERGRQPCLKVGNLEAVRDLLDVEDAVQALWLLAHKGTPGQVYNICSGVGHRIQTVLEMFLKMAATEVPVEPDPMRLRQMDAPRVVGGNARLRALGWAPRVSLGDSLAHILDYWRNRSEAS